MNANSINRTIERRINRDRALRLRSLRGTDSTYSYTEESHTKEDADSSTSPPTSSTQIQSIQPTQPTQPIHQIHQIQETYHFYDTKKEHRGYQWREEEKKMKFTPSSSILLG
jgi:hypothetical protein